MKKVVVEKSLIKNNIEVIRKNLYEANKEAKLIVVVKDNGFGLDLIQYSKVLEENNVDIIAIATIEEAEEIVKANLKTKIMLLTPVIEKDVLKFLIENNIVLTVGSLYEVELIGDVLKELGKDSTEVHVKIDSGFARYGFMPNEMDKIEKVYKEYEFLNITGIFTHFSKQIDEQSTNFQFQKFIKVIETLKEKGIDCGIRHCVASTSFVKYPNMILDAARVGSIVLGRTLVKMDGLKKVGLFKSAVLEIKTLPKGHTISYGNVFTTKKETKVAVIPVGYMDGFNRNFNRDDFTFKNNVLSILREIKKLFKDNSLKVVINGKKYKVLGRLGMYHSIVDITDSSDIEVGCEVEIPDLKPFLTNDKIRREYI